MSERIAVLMEFKGFENEELKKYLSIQFKSMPKGGMIANFLSESDYKRVKSIIFTEPILNENQQILLEWLKEEHFNLYVKSVLSNLYFYINMTAIGDLESVKIQDMINAYEKLSKVEFAQVIEVFSRWALEQEESEE